MNHFLDNLLHFARLLRAVGFTISPEQVSDLARVLEKVGVEQRQDVYYAARALFVTRQSELAAFDRAFDLFFAFQGKSPQRVIDPSQAPAARRLRPKTIQTIAEEFKQGTEPRGEPSPSEIQEVPLYSPVERLRYKRFDQLSEDEIRAARRLLEQLDWQIGRRKTRRHKRIPRGAQLDLSRVLRRNLKHGADLYDLPARERKYKPRPLVILADVSGSMERYTRMVLHLVHTLTTSDVASRVETFVFGTRLSRITRDLKRKNVDAALAQVTRHVQDIGGGTRIGEALKTFNYLWARRVLRNGAVVLIISDGWDRGDLERLRDEMARLQKSAARLIWLNPLLDETSNSVTVQGLAVALPFVDDHLPVRNLESLEQLVAVLSTLRDARPERRQMPRVAIPKAETAAQKFMERPQLATSNYVRRTMVLKTVNGVPTFVYEENPSEIM